MEEKLQEALLEILNKTVDATGKATDFIVGETPEVIRQLLLWHTVHSILFFCLSCVGVVVSVYVCRRVYIYYDIKYKTTKKQLQKDGRDGYVSDERPACLFALAGFVPSLLGVFANISWIKIWLAPKVYLLEYAASLAK